MLARIGTHLESLAHTVYGVESGRVHVHIIDNFPMVTSIIESNDALGVASAGFVRTRTFLQNFGLFPDTLDHHPGLSVARRACWLPSPPMARFLSAVRRHPPN